ncbi:MAG TPA: hypothetical protein VIQ31_06135, partial [Phormidium sp.]
MAFGMTVLGSRQFGIVHVLGYFFEQVWVIGAYQMQVALHSAQVCTWNTVLFVATHEATEG